MNERGKSNPRAGPAAWEASTGMEQTSRHILTDLTTFEHLAPNKIFIPNTDYRTEVSGKAKQAILFQN